MPESARPSKIPHSNTDESMDRKPLAKRQRMPSESSVDSDPFSEPEPELVGETNARRVVYYEEFQVLQNKYLELINKLDLAVRQPTNNYVYRGNTFKTTFISILRFNFFIFN